MFSSVSTIWVLFASALVFFMQAGFAMVETGFTRAKNAGNIIMKNLMDFAISTPIYWIIGFGLMFAGGGLFSGGIDLLSSGAYTDILPAGVPKYAFFILQVVFGGTSAAIVSGAMSERTKFFAYCVFSGIISGFVYPISGHWIWGGGWLSQLGFHDLAGSTVIHLVGGVAALVGAKMLGPRIGKFSKDGKPKAIPGHSLTLGALGVFILWFCWFGFNGGSTLSAEGDSSLLAMGNIFFNTNLAGGISTLTAMIITWIRYKKPDVSMSLNGSLAGLVAITAGADLVDPIGAALIGLIAGFVVVFGIEFVEKVLKIDDPVGAIGVHCFNGAAGTLLVGLFSANTYTYNGLTMPKGLFYGGGFKLLGVQALGVLAVAIWVAVTMAIVFFVIKKTIGLRSSKEEELLGLDISEHGLENSYADFMPMIERTSLADNEPIAERIGLAPIDEAVPVQLVSSANRMASDVKITRIDIVMKQSKFEALKEAMNRIGVTGMTVTHVLGCGMQKGRIEYYRGVEIEMNLLPKVQVSIVVTKVPVREVIETAKSVLYTGTIGDGKIFVYDVENVIKVRTGEEGYDALQDDE